VIDTKAAVESILSNILCRIESERGKEGERVIRGRGGVGKGRSRGREKEQERL
jgi:hypothetical protein